MIDYKIKYFKYKKKYLNLKYKILYGGNYFNLKNNNSWFYNNDELISFNLTDKSADVELNLADLKLYPDLYYKNIEYDKKNKKIFEKEGFGQFNCYLSKIESGKNIYICKKDELTFLYEGVNQEYLMDKEYEIKEGENDRFNVKDDKIKFKIVYNYNTQVEAFNYYFKNRTKKIGIMIAGNSGRPGGSVLEFGKLNPTKVHPYHRTQEESIMSNMVINNITQKFSKHKKCINGCGRFKYKDTKKNFLYHTCCTHCNNRKSHSYDCNRRLKNFFENKEPHRKPLIEFVDKGDKPLWGFKKDQTDNKTIQGYDYTTTNNPQAYSKPDNIFPEEDDETLNLCLERRNSLGKKIYDESKTFPCKLIFVAGPNINIGRPGGSMRRTYSKKAEEYNFFRDGVKAAIKSCIYQCIFNKINVLFLAAISCGIYSSPIPNINNRIKKDIKIIVDELIQEISQEFSTSKISLKEIILVINSRNQLDYYLEQ